VDGDPGQRPDGDVSRSVVDASVARDRSVAIDTGVTALVGKALRGAIDLVAIERGRLRRFGRPAA
jgi:hypothetical protein